MGPPASSAFTLLGAALLVATGATSRRRWAAGLGVVVVGIGALSFVGYLYGASLLFGFSKVTGIAWQTAAMLISLGVAAVANVPERGLAAALRRDDAGGVVLRRLVVPIVVAPLVLGWLRVRGQNAGLYDTALGSAMLVIAMMSVLFGLLWWTANGISRHVRVAREAEDQVREREALLRTVTTEARVGLVLLDEERRYLFANAMYADILGLPDADIIGKRIEDVVGPLYEQTRPRLEQAFRGESVRYELRVPMHPKTRREHFYDVWHAPRRIGASVRQVVVVLTDITNRKEAEEALRQADVRKDEFLATLAHELRNPLAPFGPASNCCGGAARTGTC